MRSDVRKVSDVSDLPRNSNSSWATPNYGRSPLNSQGHSTVGHSRHRTSDGTAAKRTITQTFSSALLTAAAAP
jgi:hypothetical protein